MKQFIKNNSLLRALALPFYRAKIATSYLAPQCKQAALWTFRSRETTNFTYDLTPANKDYLCAALALVTGVPIEILGAYLREIEDDMALQFHVFDATTSSKLAYKADSAARYHKRLGWYALTRALKPKVIVETGVDKGLGSVVLCAALIRNREDGHPGRYYGTDLNPEAGYLLKGIYSQVGEVLYGDSVESLRAMETPIDLFINDSDHSADYEALEYETVSTRLAPNAVILGDNAHVTDKLLRFSKSHDRKFLFWKEEPMNHWYPGGGIGFSWTNGNTTTRKA